MVKWLNRVKPVGEPQATKASTLSTEKLADGADASFRERARWWGGDD
jgi:hypothetical protein